MWAIDMNKANACSHAAILLVYTILIDGKRLEVLEMDFILCLKAVSEISAAFIYVRPVGIRGRFPLYVMCDGVIILSPKTPVNRLKYRTPANNWLYSTNQRPAGICSYVTTREDTCSFLHGTVL